VLPAERIFATRLDGIYEIYSKKSSALALLSHIPAEPFLRAVATRADTPNAPSGVTNLFVAVDDQVHGWDDSERNNVVKINAPSSTSATRDATGTLVKIANVLVLIHRAFYRVAEWIQRLLTIARDCDNERRVTAELEQTLRSHCNDPITVPSSGQAHVHLQECVQMFVQPVAEEMILQLDRIRSDAEQTQCLVAVISILAVKSFGTRADTLIRFVSSVLSLPKSPLVQPDMRSSDLLNIACLLVNLQELVTSAKNQARIP